MRIILMSLLLAVVAGCTTKRVYHRPLSDVARAIDSMQPQMLADVAPECQKFGEVLGVFTNEVPGKTYGIMVGQYMNSGYAGPRFHFVATNIDGNKTEVEVFRMTSRRARNRHLEQMAQDALTKKLETSP